MSDGVRRWAMTSGDFEPVAPVAAREHRAGAWVRYDDYVTLQAERDALAQELHAAINEPMYAGTRQDWIYRAQKAEADRDALKRERDAENRVGRNCTRLLKAVGAERDALRARLVLVDQLLEDSLGGFYLSEPATEPLGRVRQALQVKYDTLRKKTLEAGQDVPDVDRWR